MLMAVSVAPHTPHAITALTVLTTGLPILGAVRVVMAVSRFWVRGAAITATSPHDDPLMPCMGRVLGKRLEPLGLEVWLLRPTSPVTAHCINLLGSSHVYLLAMPVQAWSRCLVKTCVRMLCSYNVLRR